MRDEGVLFEGLRLGSTQAFEELLREDGAALRRVARLYVPEDRAPTLVREAWAVALPGLDMFTWHTTLRAWLTGILVSHGRAARSTAPAGRRTDVPDGAVRAAASLVPAGARAAGGAATGGPRPVTGPLPWASLGWSHLWSDDSWAVLEQALVARPLEERELLWLLDVEGWPWREVLDTLGLTEAQGAGLRDRGRAALAEVVEAHVGATGATDPPGTDGTVGTVGTLGGDADHPGGAERLAGVATLLHALRPVAADPAPDPRLVRAFVSWRRARGVPAWRRWWWETAQRRSRVPTVSPKSSPVGTNPSRR